MDSKTISLKVRLIQEEILAALDAYSKAANSVLQDGADGMGPDTVTNNDTDALRQQIYLGMLFNGLATLFAQEANRQVNFMRTAKVSESSLMASSSAMKIKAMTFVEKLVADINTSAIEEAGLGAILTALGGIQGGGGSLPPAPDGKAN